MTHTDRPLPGSGALSVLAGLLAVLLVANRPTQLVALGIAAVGLAALALGIELRHRDYPLVGGALAVGGAGVVLGGLGYGLALSRGFTPKLELLPGVLGLLVLVLGVAAVRPGYERWFASAGAGGILVAVLASGFLQDASVVALLAATAATVVAWDAAEQAINLGEHVGREARTRRVEVAHGGVGLLVGGVGVLLAVGITAPGVNGLPFVGLAAMLGAAVVLMTALET